jgi:hypothetical protein
MYLRTELGDLARWPLSLTLDQAPQRRGPLYLSRGTTQPFSLKANKTCTTIELSMVPDLLIGHFKTHRFDVELFCPLQIFEVEFNTDESRSNPLHKILSGFE